MRRISDDRAVRISGRRAAVILAGLVVAVTLGLVVALPVRAAVRTATPATLDGVFGSAQPGDVIELAAGNYGQFNGGQKGGTVTLRPQPGAAVTMALQFDGASNIRVEGVTVTALGITDGTHDITV